MGHMCSSDICILEWSMRRFILKNEHLEGTYKTWLPSSCSYHIHRYKFNHDYDSHFTHKTESTWPLHFKHSHWWKRRSRSKFASHYPWGANGVCECKMDVKSTWIPTWHRMDHVSMVTCTMFKNHLLEVGLTQNWETMALRTLTTVDLFYFIMCEDPHV